MKGFLALLMGGGIGLLVGIVLGALIVTGFGYIESGGTQIPFNIEHNKLAGRVSVTVNGANTELKHLMSTLAPFYPQDARNVAKFAKSTGNLPTSVWAFVQDGNVQVTMSIIGPPAANESVYLLEFGRLTYSTVHVSGPDFTIDWMQGSQDGYAMRDVTVS